MWPTVKTKVVRVPLYQLILLFFITFLQNNTLNVITAFHLQTILNLNYNKIRQNLIQLDTRNFKGHRDDDSRFFANVFISKAEMIGYVGPLDVLKRWLSRFWFG